MTTAILRERYISPPLKNAPPQPSLESACNERTQRARSVQQKRGWNCNTQASHTTWRAAKGLKGLKNNCPIPAFNNQGARKCSPCGVDPSRSPTPTTPTARPPKTPLAVFFRWLVIPVAVFWEERWGRSMAERLHSNACRWVTPWRSRIKGEWRETAVRESFHEGNHTRDLIILHSALL
jgi:hypothetical protein